MRSYWSRAAPKADSNGTAVETSPAADPAAATADAPAEQPGPAAADSLAVIVDASDQASSHSATDTGVAASDASPDAAPRSPKRRMSFRPLGFLASPRTSSEPTPPPKAKLSKEEKRAAAKAAAADKELQRAAKKEGKEGAKAQRKIKKAGTASAKKAESTGNNKEEATRQASKKADKAAEESALALRTLMVGSAAMPTTPGEVVAAAAEKKSKNFYGTQLKKIKSQLLHPKAANLVILKLRSLPLPHWPSTTAKSTPDVSTAAAHPNGPIHAVCLDCTEEEADQQHFSRLQSITVYSDAPNIISVASADIRSIVPLMREMHVVSLLSAPDFGFGQPPDGNGLLAGTVPSPAAIAEGVMQISQQLMALGYATGQAINPDHAGVYPPLDRISVLTYWWGLEICLPPASMKYLSHAKSISNALINFLSALAMFNNGVREILPFIRYISQYIDFEWSAIAAQNEGKGVVCASTWVMPAALVPRPWDFPDPPTVNNQIITPVVTSADPALTPPVMVPAVKIIPATLPRSVTVA